MVIIEVAKVAHRDDAAKFERFIRENRTYMKFTTTVCPFAGMWQVNVETDYPCSAQEAQDLLNMTMFYALSK